MLTTPKGFHTMPVDAFLRALMRDVAWGFFYGTVNFDQVFGTTNYYGEVDMFLGATNEAYTSAGRDFVERFKVERADGYFQADGLRLDQRRIRSVRRPDGNRRSLGRKERRQRRGG